MKRIISLALSLVLVLSVMSLSPLSLAESRKITDELASAISELNPSDTVEIYIWLSGIDYMEVENEVLEATGFSSASFELDGGDLEFLLDFAQNDESRIAAMTEYLERTEGERVEIAAAVDEYNMASRQIAAREYNELNGGFAERHLRNAYVIFQSRLSPMIIAEVNVSDIARFARLREVALLDLHVEIEMEPATCLASSLPSIGADHTRNNLGLTGQGVVVGVTETGVVELGVPDLMHLQNSGRLIRLSPFGSFNWHASLVAAIIAGNRGMAPDATIVSGSTRAHMEQFILTHGVNVVNQSTQHNGLAGVYDINVMWYDHLVYRHNITFVHSAGNFPTFQTTFPGMAYNIINVGNFDHRGTVATGDDVWGYVTQWSSRSGSTANLAYKPDVIAPGFGMGIPGHPDNRGTSFSAPHIAGLAAQIMQARPELKLRPDLTKAIILASTDRKVGEQMGSITMRQGAGIPNATHAANAMGYAGTLVGNMASYDIEVELEAGVVTQIVLSWFMRHSAPTILGAVENPQLALTNLDLELRAPNGQVVGSSSSPQNNAELIRLTPTVSGTYTIRVIRRTANNTSERFAVATSIQRDFEWDTFILGDADGNDTINAADITIMRRYIAATNRPAFAYAEDLDMDAADITRNGFVNSSDVTQLRRWLAAGSTNFPIGNTFSRPIR